MGSGTEVASPGANPEIRLYLPHPQTQGWRHTARQAGPEEKKKPFLPRPQDVQARCDFSAEARDSPETAQISAAHAFPVDSTLLDIGGGGPAGEHEDQEGAGFGQRGAWRKCRSWGPRTGTL